MAQIIIQKGNKQDLDNFKTLVNAELDVLQNDWNTLTQAEKAEALRSSSILSLKALRYLANNAIVIRNDQ